MAVPIGEGRSIWHETNDTYQTAMAMRGTLRQQLVVDTAALTYAAPMNYGDMIAPLRSELTDYPLFIETDKTDPINPIHTVVDKTGDPQAGYSVDAATGRIGFAPLTGGGKPAGGLWHSRNETDQDYYFGRLIPLQAVPAGPLNLTVDGDQWFMIYVNGTAVGAGDQGTSKTVDVQPFLKVGDNVITIRSLNDGGSADPWVRAAGTVLNANDLDSTTVANWSASRYSVKGIAGQITFLNYQQGELTKRQDKIKNTVTVMETLHALLRAESQTYDQLLSLVK